ncbi:hypothetical protein HJC99_03840 [Candidatus Saccharibacteria bacterium]|nr:hypothetical protein [Candidatus Saccharibacteria bacterium]
MLAITTTYTYKVTQTGTCNYVSGQKHSVTQTAPVGGPPVKSGTTVLSRPITIRSGFNTNLSTDGVSYPVPRAHAFSQTITMTGPVVVTTKLGKLSGPPIAGNRLDSCQLPRLLI